MGLWTADPLLTLSQTTSTDLTSAISSLEEDCGASPPGSPDGPTTSPSGAPPARASRSRSREKAPAMTTQGTCGPTSFASPVPDGPLASWENRLRERLAMVGSTECALIWREKVTPAGASISRLSPWTPPISASGSTGSPWPTPDASLGGADPLTRKTGLSVQTFMVHADPKVWPTPTVADAQGGHLSRSGKRGNELLLKGMMKAATWTTPMASDVRKQSENPETTVRRLAAGRQVGLNAHVALTMSLLDPSGQTPSGSDATTEKRGAPNPAFACWLMGWPDELISGALRGIASFRSSRRKSSKPTSKRSDPCR